MTSVFRVLGLSWIPAFAGMTFLSYAAHAQLPPPPAPPRAISVSGEAKQELAPDRAILFLSVTSRNASLAEAKKENDKLLEKLVAITRDFKIPAEKVATSALNISPQYRYVQESGQQVFDGYMVSRSLQVTMDKLDIHERVLSAVVDAKIDQVNHVQFTLARPEEHAAGLRLAAFADAKAKAEAPAAAAGMKLGKPLTIATSGAQPPMPPPMPYMAKAMRADMAEASVAPSLPGLITLQESVQVTFEME